MISNIDYLPTILNALGVPVPANVQGRSLAQLLDGTGYEPRDAVFAELTYHDYYDPIRIIRTRTHKLVVNFSSARGFMDSSQAWRPPSFSVVPHGRHPYVELYDLEADPWESNDLLGYGHPGRAAKDIAPEHAALGKALLGRLRQHMLDTRDPLLEGAVTSPQHRRAMEFLNDADEAVNLRQGRKGRP
jgi:arylsulfatase A-like enzyme